MRMPQILYICKWCQESAPNHMPANCPQQNSHCQYQTCLSSSDIDDYIFNQEYYYDDEAYHNMSGEC